MIGLTGVWNITRHQQSTAGSGFPATVQAFPGNFPAIELQRLNFFWLRNIFLIGSNLFWLTGYSFVFPTTAGCHRRLTSPAGKINSSHTHGYLRSCPTSLGAGRSRGSRDFRVRIRVGSWNVGSLMSKSRELIETLLKSKVDILCVQETRWKGEEAVDIGDYKLGFSGSRVARNGVGIFIGPRHKDNIVGVGRCSDRIMSVRLVIQEESYMVICAYAPHAGLGEEEKSRFWESLDEVVRSCPADHRLLIGGDLNGHIGTISDGYAGVHGVFGYGVRNEEGRSILEFAVAHDLVVANSFFRKTEAQLATFHSGGHSTQIDYLLLRKGDLRTCRDCKALTTWTCSTQHRLLVMDLVPQRRVTRRGRPAQPRILWKNLNEEKAETFKASVLERVEAVMDTVTHGDADQMWNSFASTIRDVAKETLGVAVGTSRGHKSCRESWWISDEVQTKVALKQLRFRELVTCRDGTRDDRTRAEERYIRAIMDMYDGAKACVRMPVGNTEYFPIEVGLHQGLALSPFLFALILDELYRGIQENIPWCLIFADDIVLVSETKDELNRRLEQWREALEQNGLRISRQKTEYLSCEFGRTDDELNVGGNISIGDQILHPQESFRYLGSVLHKSGRIDEDVTHRIKVGMYVCLFFYLSAGVVYSLMYVCFANRFM
ncbi:uncharacterized protein [Rutidosis leptorrhynchoides]|uniref:uncharacterized protein n=1 Tax=Rutidosis leptorrhynchoides TaxID=125765 RepID=UPI003A99A3B7